MEEYIWNIGESFFSEDSKEHKQMQATEELKKLGISVKNKGEWMIRHPPTGLIWKSEDCFYFIKPDYIRVHFRKILPDLESSNIFEYSNVYSIIKSQEIQQILFRSFIEQKIIEVYFLPLDNGLMYNTVSIEDVLPKKNKKPKTTHIQSFRIIRDSAMIKKLKKNHECKCQICGNRILVNKNPEKFYAEGHHLKPLSLYKETKKNLDVKENIIILCPNHHIEFEKQALAIDISDCETILHIDGTKNTFHGEKIKDTDIHSIDEKFINHHYKKFKKKQR